MYKMISIIISSSSEKLSSIEKEWQIIIRAVNVKFSFDSFLNKKNHETWSGRGGFILIWEGLIKTKMGIIIPNKSETFD